VYTEDEGRLPRDFVDLRLVQRKRLAVDGVLSSPADAVDRPTQLLALGGEESGQRHGQRAPKEGNIRSTPLGQLDLAPPGVNN